MSKFFISFCIVQNNVFRSLIKEMGDNNSGNGYLIGAAQLFEQDCRTIEKK